MIPDIEEIDIELSKRNLMDFVHFTMKGYNAKWFHERIATILDRFVNGDLDRLILTLPPQHGKSELISRRLPSFMLGLNPDLKIALVSYNDTFARKFNKANQRLIQSEEYQKIFPDTNLFRHKEQIETRYLKNAHEFEVVGKEGKFISVGVGGQLTGEPVDIVIIDDIIKNRKEAESKVFRENIWDFWTDVIETRLHNDSKRLITLTRWHEDDIVGRILESEGDDWEYLNIPAIKEDNEDPEDPRMIDDELWPERHSKKKILKARDRSLRTFTSLYQGKPSAREGDVIKRAWFSIQSIGKVRRELPPATIITMNYVIDSAYTADEKNDQTAIGAYFTIEGMTYIFRVESIHMEFPELITFIKRFCKETGYNNQSRIYIEPKASGKSIAQQLKKKTGLNMIESEPPDTDKLTRVIAATPTLQSGRIVLIYGNWNEAYLDQLCSFPNAKLKDIVDITVMICDNMDSTGPIYMGSTNI